MNSLLESGDRVTLVDLRNALEWREAGAHKIPGALHVSYEDIEASMPQIPLDRDVVLYCS